MDKKTAPSSGVGSITISNEVSIVSVVPVQMFASVNDYSHSGQFALDGIEIPPGIYHRETSVRLTLMRDYSQDLKQFWNPR